MQKKLPKIYCFVDEFNLTDLSKLSKDICIIYRNYNDIDHLDNIIKLKRFCKIRKNKLYISNNVKLSIKLGLDGVYIPSFNKTLNYKNIPKKNFEIIGSAHNIKEVINKEYQGCTKIFLSPIFKTKKNKSYLGITKFNIIRLIAKRDIISLGGINSRNIKYLRMCRVEGFAGISWIKKNGPSINTGPF